MLIGLEFGLGAVGLAALTSLVHHSEDLLSKPLHNKDTHKSMSLSMVAASLIAIALSLLSNSLNYSAIPENNDALLGLIQGVLVSLALKVLPHVLASSNINPRHSAVGLLIAVCLCCFLDSALFTIPALLVVVLENSLRSTEEEVLPLKSAVGFWKLLFSHADSRRITIFLLVNLSFMGVEAVYGYWTNSLGLISDAVHMAFDCTALAIGLYASYLSRLPADRTFTYGHGRFEVLSGLINAIFLVFVGFRVLAESIERIMEPPEITTDNLILVSVLGLLVNMIGLCFFHDHSHGGEDENSNMRGVFLHVLADALGSVGVITSSILVQTLNWYIADPICSLIISLLIFLSCIPLMTDSLHVLTQKDVNKTVSKAKKLLSAVPGVEEVEALHAWTLKSNFQVVTAQLKAEPGADCNAVTLACKAALSEFKSVTVQVSSLP
jgi:zinc transporter 5/7